MMKIRNLYDTLAHTSAVFGEKNGVSDGREHLTYGELLRRTDFLSAYLKNVRK